MRFGFLGIKSWIVAGMLALGTSSAANGALLTYFDFGAGPSATLTATKDRTSDVPVPTVVQVGGGIDVTPAGGVAFVDAEATAHAAGVALTWDNGVNTGTNGFSQFFDTTGFWELTARFDYRSSATGSPSITLDYKVGAGSYVNVFTNAALATDAAFHAFSTNLASFGALNNVPNVELRYTFSPGSGTGTTRIDNLQVTSAFIPEPASVLVAAPLAWMFIARRRRA